MTYTPAEQEAWATLAGFGPDPVEAARERQEPVEVTVDAPTRGVGGTVGAALRDLAGTWSDIQTIDLAIRSRFRRE